MEFTHDVLQDQTSRISLADWEKMLEVDPEHYNDELRLLFFPQPSDYQQDSQTRRPKWPVESKDLLTITRHHYPQHNTPSDGNNQRLYRRPCFLSNTSDIEYQSIWDRLQSKGQIKWVTW